jgi:hypothetical protein
MRAAEQDLGVCFYDDKLAAEFARRQDIENAMAMIAASSQMTGCICIISRLWI